MKNIYCVAVALFLSLTHASAQATGDYKSNGAGGGAWNAASSWLRYNGTTYVAAIAAPSNSSNNIVVQGGDAITISSNETINQLTVDFSGTVSLASGQTVTLGGGMVVNGAIFVNGTLVCGTYDVTGTGSFSLNAGATLNIGSASGITSSASSGNIQTTMRTFSNAANYIYTSNVAQLTGNGLPTPIIGTITNNNTNTASGLSLTQSTAVNSPGSFIVPPGSVLTCSSSTNITGSGSFTLATGARFFIGSAAGISTVAGSGNIQTATKTFSASANYTYNGTGAQNMGTAFPSPFTGMLTIANSNGSGCGLSNNLVVNSPGNIVVTGAFACPASYIVSGSGSFSINTGGTLLTANISGINAAGISGSIQTSAINFPTDANYTYYGSASQITGTGLPATVGALYINNSSAGNVSLTNSVTVGGNLTLNAGVLCLNGNTLTMATGKTIIRQSGSISTCGGSLVYAGTVNLTYTSTNNITTSSELPTATNVLNTFTVSLTAGKTLTLASNVTVNGSVTMTNGSLALGGNTLTYASGATLVYSGSTAQTVSDEWPNTNFGVNISIKNTAAASGVIPNANKGGYTGTVTVSNGGYFNSGNFILNGTGNFAVNAGGTFITPHPLGVSPSGAIQLTGMRTFSNGSSYTFSGTSTQVTGPEMPASVKNITINNTAATPTVTLGNLGTGIQTITGTLALTAGAFDISANNMSLTFYSANTPVTQSAGSLTTGSTSSLQFGTVGNIGGSAFTLPNNMFTTAPTLTNLTINRTNSLTLGNQNITLNGTLTLTAGVLDLNSTTLIFQNGNTPVQVTAGSLNVSVTASLQFGSPGSTGGNAFTMPNNLFTTAPTFSNFTVNRANALTLGTQNITLTGALNLVNGRLNIGASTLGLNGVIAVTNGVLNGGATSGISVGGTGNNLTLPAIANDLNTLTIARPNKSGVPAVNLSIGISIFTNLNLSGGSLALGTSNLTMGSGATITNMNDSRFIVTNNSASTGGYLIRNVAAVSVLFPIGTSTYTPALINNAAGTADAYQVRVFDGILAAGTSGVSFGNSNHAVNKTWLIEEAVAGGSNASVILQWNATDENASYDRTNSFISHYAPSSWDDAASSAATTVSVGVYSQTRTGLTSFSPYSVQEKLTLLPVRWLQVSATKKEQLVVLNWRVADDATNLQFEVERSTNGTDFLMVGTVKARGSEGIIDYSFVDNKLPGGMMWYRIKQVDKGGQFSYSKTLSVTNNTSPVNIQLFPIPFSEQLTVELYTAAAQASTITITDASGKLVKKQILVLAAGRNSIQLPTAQFPHGWYIVHINSRDINYTCKIIK